MSGLALRSILISRYPQSTAGLIAFASWLRAIRWGLKTTNRLLFMISILMASLPINAGTVTYIYTDPQGTPLAETDANGNVTSAFDYKAFGAPAMGSPQSGPGFTGHVADADSALLYMQARYYDAMTGRFLSSDPIAPADGNLGSFNRFAYADNNPILNIDPTGMEPRDPCDNPGAICALDYHSGYSSGEAPQMGGSKSASSSTVDDKKSSAVGGPREHVLPGAMNIASVISRYGVYTNQQGMAECVELVKQLLDAPPASLWSQGRPLRLGMEIEPGTAIATFVPHNGRMTFPYSPELGHGHAAIYLGMNTAGVLVVEQWQGLISPQIRRIPWTNHSPQAALNPLSNSAKYFSTIKW